MNLLPKFKRVRGRFVEYDPYDVTVVSAWLAICGMLAVSLGVAAALFLTWPAKAQVIYWCDAAECHYDWAKIRECARRPFAKPDRAGDLTAPLAADRVAETQFQLISACRQALDARHAGWVAATAAPDPIPPEPMMREDDFK